MGRDRTEAVLIAALVVVTACLIGLTAWGLVR